jgi:hypothetical protein
MDHPATTVANHPVTCQCGGTGRWLWVRVTERGNTVIDHYGRCPGCGHEAASRR